MTHESLAIILHCHAQFLAFCAEKETVLDFVAHVFPPEHALRQAVTRALWGDVLSSFRLAADDVCCQLCGVLGDEEFTKKTSGKPCTDLFYGASLQALVLGASARPQETHGFHSQWLPLEIWSRIVELPQVARGFMTSARALPVPPRIAAKFDRCEARFRESWARVVKALRSVRVDTRQLVVVHMALRRILARETAEHVLCFYARFPIAIEDAPPRAKRRRLA